MFSVYLSLFLFLISKKVNSLEVHNEEIFIKPLPNKYINTYFQFSTEWNIHSREEFLHTDLFPRAIAELLYIFDIKEFHISLTQGLWRPKKWGFPVISAPPGAEVWAWFKKDLPEDTVNLQWKKFCNTLSGLLCSSFNFIDMSNTVQPKYSFLPQYGISSFNYSKNSNIRYSTLPRENVCTENLTPWKKMLPCSMRNGFASLLNSGFVHNTNYHSLSIELRTLCINDDSFNCKIQYKQTANFIYDGKLFGESYSFRKMFGQGLNGVCYLANTSRVYIDVSENDISLNPKPSNIITSQRGSIISKYAMYDIQSISPKKLFNIVLSVKEKKEHVQVTTEPIIHAHRYIRNQGQQYGQIVTRIKNSHWNKIDIVLQENLPWYVPFYLHTLNIKINQQKINPKIIHFLPSRQRLKPNHLEILFSIPPKKVAVISIDFDFNFLKWLEYPPDANHGHYIGAAIISTLLPNAKNYTSIPLDGFLLADIFNNTNNHFFQRLYTEILLLTLPTPDFSMPYNVLCLACTVIALAFGPIHSATTKRIVIETGKDSSSLWGKLKKKIKAYIKKKTDG